MQNFFFVTEIMKGIAGIFFVIISSKNSYFFRGLTLCKMYIRFEIIKDFIFVSNDIDCAVSVLFVNKSDEVIVFFKGISG